MYINEIHYNELEDLLLESIFTFNKNIELLNNKKNLEALYECAFKYCRLKLEKFIDIKYNYRNYFKFPAVLKESIGTKKYNLMVEGFLDWAGEKISSAASWVSDKAAGVIELAKKSPGEFLQGLADIISIFDPTGLVDLINGSIYLYRGEKLSAFFCGIGAAFTLPGFISTVASGGVAGVAGVPMIAAGKTLKGILKAGGRISEVLIKYAAKILKMGGILEKILSVMKSIPGLGSFAKFFAESVPKFIKAAKEGGKTETILGKVFGTASDVIKAPGKMADTLVAKGTALAGEKTAEKIGLHVAQSKLGKAAQFGGAGLMAVHMGSKGQELAKGGEKSEEENKDSEVSDEDIAAAMA